MPSISTCQTSTTRKSQRTSRLLSMVGSGCTRSSSSPIWIVGRCAAGSARVKIPDEIFRLGLPRQCGASAAPIVALHRGKVPPYCSSIGRDGALARPVSRGLVGKRRAEQADGWAAFHRILGQRTPGKCRRARGGHRTARGCAAPERGCGTIAGGRVVSTRTIGTYELDGLLGEGGIGQGYAAQDK